MQTKNLEMLGRHTGGLQGVLVSLTVVGWDWGHI